MTIAARTLGRHALQDERSLVRRGACVLGVVLATTLYATSLLALEPPHDFTSNTINCNNCHVVHAAPGAAITKSAGNANLCQSCHVVGGPAAAKALPNASEALPWPGLPAGVTPSGSAHRWDSGPSGHVAHETPGGVTGSTGTVQSSGAFTGRLAKTFTITISTSGDVGASTFTWTDTLGGSGSGTTGAALLLDEGISITFTNGTTTPSFVANDRWGVYVRTDLTLPTDIDMTGQTGSRIADGKIQCSTCHNQHSQAYQPFDPASPSISYVCTGGSNAGGACTRPLDCPSGTCDPVTFVCTGGSNAGAACTNQSACPGGSCALPYVCVGGSNAGASCAKQVDCPGGSCEGRHYQRIADDQAQMCSQCHGARDVSNSSGGSHPVGITIPAGDFQAPSSLPLDATGKVRCLTCHVPHFGPTTDGTLARMASGSGVADTRALCVQCHTLANTAQGSHFDAATGALWPGGQYGATFPAVTNGAKRGMCTNCHWPHGWPDDANPSIDYTKLRVERYDDSRVAGADLDDAEDLCFTCHDGSPATSNVRGDFVKGTDGASVFHHPVKDSEQPQYGRAVECVDCHNPHEATSADRLAGVSGVDLDGNAVTAGSRQLEQYELCFKCHGDTYNSSRPMTSNKRLDFAAANSAYHPVVQAGRNQSTNLNNALLGGLTTSSTIRCTDCHNSDAFAATTGVVVDSTAVTVGPHGSNFAPVLRANFNLNYTNGPSSWNANSFNVCFRCHDASKLVTARRFDEGASTNFYDDVDGRDNLHWLHLVDRANNARATCQNCHFDIHSNRSASNTQYRVDLVLYASPPPGIKTHLVNFSPDILPIGGRAKPEWWMNTVTRERRCYLDCHSATMNGYPYRPGNGGDDAPTYSAGTPTPSVPTTTATPTVSATPTVTFTAAATPTVTSPPVPTPTGTPTTTPSSTSTRTPTPSNTPTATPTSTPTAQTYRDAFTSISYSGSNGTVSWTATPWSETDSGGGGASGGDILVVNDAANCSAGNCLRVSDIQNDDRIVRAANLSGAATATLTYDYKHNAGADHAVVAIQVWNISTSSWNQVKTYGNGASGSGSESFALTAQQIGAGSQIRFYVVDSRGGSFRLWVDNLQIAFQ